MINEFMVTIEISANSLPVKYEMCKETNQLIVDRFIGTGMSYPVNYGYIPNTLSEDGDPIDVLVITPYPIISGAGIKCRALGMIKMEDESGVDTKIIAVPIKKTCQMYNTIDTINDIPKLLIDQITHFFENYKKLEKGKWVKLSGINGIDEALHEIEASFVRFTND